MILFGYDTIIKNISFVNVPTQPFKERASRCRKVPFKAILEKNETLKKKFTQNYALAAVDTLPCHHVREMKDTSSPPQNIYPKWRRFTANQVRKAEDDLQSPLSSDGVTLFSI